MVHVIYIPLSKKPETGLQITYVLNADKKKYFVTNIYHLSGPEAGPTTMTNMCHLVMDVMTGPVFADLHSTIDTAIRKKHE